MSLILLSLFVPCKSSFAFNSSSFKILLWFFSVKWNFKKNRILINGGLMSECRYNMGRVWVINVWQHSSPAFVTEMERKYYVYKRLNMFGNIVVSKGGEQILLIIYMSMVEYFLNRKMTSVSLYGIILSHK